MTRRLVCLWWLLAQVGCNSLVADNERGKLEAKRAESEIRKGLKIGSPKPEVEAFLRRQGWLFDFDAFQGRFVGVVYRSPDRACVVTAYIYIDKDNGMSRSEVDVALKYL